MGKSSSKLSAESLERLKQTDADGGTNTPTKDSPTMPNTTMTTSPLGEKELMELRKGFSHDHLTDAQLLNMLANEQSLAQLLTEIFYREVELSDCMQTLLRGNCLASKIMSHCFRKFGSKYLRQLLEPHIKPLTLDSIDKSDSKVESSSTTSTREVNTQTSKPQQQQQANLSPAHRLTSQLSTAYNNVESLIHGTNSMQLERSDSKQSSATNDISYEIDSARLEEDGDISINQQNLLKLTKQILDSILASVDDFPPQLNSMCICLRQVLCSRFPDKDANLKAVGTVIFLRYINPAIVAPYEAGIVERQPSQRTMRGLMLVSKILQNIANNVEFSKEEHMLPFNDFVREQFEPLRRWVSEISSERDDHADDMDIMLNSK